ncbi:DUF6090 family protein [Algoriphagus taiwanensis]|uniref:Uncharacterized protein n=1 Tax=Algoriphagus taiwanensis TaxID=1445656 RepID=A0ABQ6Q6Z6_9BACT|nr:hypothetical protein Ataiwa_35610 [Algoriphagus taiwanensis]
MISFFRKIRQKLLAQNRVTRYLVYALGEILLVTIGILIALQVNNWNEKRKQKLSVDAAINSLIEDLKLDSLQLMEEMASIDKDLERLDGFRIRLSKPNSTVDTLRHIARYEYLPFFDPSNERNRNTIVSLLSTGSIGYFDEEVKKKILKFSTLQLKEIKVMDENVRIFLDIQNSFGEGIGAQSDNSDPWIQSIAITGPLADLYWKNKDDKELLNYMLNTISGKMLMQKIILFSKLRLLEETNEMLDFLQNPKK